MIRVRIVVVLKNLVKIVFLGFLYVVLFIDGIMNERFLLECVMKYDRIRVIVVMEIYVIMK